MRKSNISLVYQDVYMMNLDREINYWNKAFCTKIQKVSKIQIKSKKLYLENLKYTREKAR